MCVFSFNLRDLFFIYFKIFIAWYSIFNKYKSSSTKYTLSFYIFLKKTQLSFPLRCKEWVHQCGILEPNACEPFMLFTCLCCNNVHPYGFWVKFRFNICISYLLATLIFSRSLKKNFFFSNYMQSLICLLLVQKSLSDN